MPKGGQLYWKKSGTNNDWKKEESKLKRRESDNREDTKVIGVQEDDAMNRASWRQEIRTGNPTYWDSSEWKKKKKGCNLNYL